MDTVHGEYMEDGVNFVLSDPYDWMVHPIYVHVPIGFKTDFASIPQPLRWLIPVSGRHRAPAVVHDWFYRKGDLVDRISGVPITRKPTRKEADTMFLMHMEQCGVPAWKRQAMYWGVRSGGWVAWRKNRK